MSCIGECQRLIGGYGCRCKEIWKNQRQIFLDHFKRERQHEAGFCDCDDICLYPDNPTSDEDRERMLEAYTEQEFYNYHARYKERILDMKQKASLLLNKKRETKFWVRATFSKKQEIEEIDMMMNRIINLKPFKGIVANVEFWSDEGKNFNPHSHMLIPKNCKKSKIIKDLSRIMKVKENMIEIREIRDSTNQEKYIMGDKQDNKLINVFKDNETRQKFNILKVYKDNAL